MNNQSILINSSISSFQKYTDQLLLMCFGPEEPKPNSGWGSSSSRMLYQFLIKEVILNLTIHINSADFTKEKFLWEFKVQIKNQLNIHASEKPIIWKTKPSRKNSDMCKCVTVNIENHVLPSFSETTINLNETVQNRAVREQRDNSWSKFKCSLHKDSTQFKVNIRHFIIHCLIFDLHKNLDLKYYENKKSRQIYESERFRELELNTWFEDDYAHFQNACKNAKNNCKVQSRRNLLEEKCEQFNFSSTFNAQELREMDKKRFIDIIFKETNKSIISRINDMRKGS